MACVSSTTTAGNKFLSLESAFFPSSTTSATSPSSRTSTLFLSHAFPLSSSLSLTALAPHASLRPFSCFASIRPRRQERKQQLQLCRAATEYVFPDPIAEFADSETNKFRNHLLEKLSKKAVFGDSVKEVVAICTEILSTFLHTEYGGPGTLLVIPFIDMADTINERELPGGPQAARAAVVWAQKHVDNDWKEWTGKND